MKRNIFYRTWGKHRYLKISFTDLRKLPHSTLERISKRSYCNTNFAMICELDSSNIINELSYKGFDFIWSYNRKSRTNPITNLVPFNPYWVMNPIKKRLQVRGIHGMLTISKIDNHIVFLNKNENNFSVKEKDILNYIKSPKHIHSTL